MRLGTLRTAMALAASVALLAACNSGTDPAQPAEKVNLTFWTWVPNIDAVVAKWNAANPNIQVTASNQAQGDELVTKLLTADQAGNPPDLVQAEYQALPTLVSKDALADVSAEVAGAEDDFAEGVWRTPGGGIKRGAVHGTTDAIGELPAEDAVEPSDVVATMYRCLGIDPEKEYRTPTGRPIKILGKGKAIDGILS